MTPTRKAALLVLLAAACGETPSTGEPASLALTGAGVSAPVRVTFDGQGVPHVEADGDADAAYALGWIHARDRLFQIDVMRKAARGRLSELVGPAGLDADQAIRTVFTAQAPVASGPRAGSYRIEDVVAATLTPEFRAVLQAYADGVNRYLGDLAAARPGTSPRPYEYAILDQALGGLYVVAPWTVEDTLAVARLQSWALSGSADAEAGVGRLATAVTTACGGDPTTCRPAAFVSDLLRFAPAAQAFILPDAGIASPGAGTQLARLPGLDTALARGQALLARTRSLSGGGREPAGSNNWVLRPSLASGAALVANDPHLSLSNPANFHLAHVTTPTRNVGGMAFPGAPVIPIGLNDRIGWGDTVMGYDVTDLFYFPEASPGGPPLVPPGATPVEIAETYAVRGRTSPVAGTVLLVPGYGPVISHAGGVYLTLRWTGQEPSNEAEAFFALGAARSVDEAFAALDRFQVGAQNFVIADVDGNVGYDAHAYVPVRKGGCWGPGKTVVPWAPMPGFDGSCAWTGRVPDADLPRGRNPARGFFVTANNDATGVTAGNDPLSGPHYLYPTRDLGYRAARIEQLLSARPSGLTLDDMTTIQADVKSLFAADVVPALLAWFDARRDAVAGKGLEGAVALLRGWADPANPWSYRTPTGLTGHDPAGPASADAGAVEAASASMIFHALLPRLAGAILDPELAVVTLDGAPLTALRLGGLTEDQQLAKYLSALALTVTGHPPPVPLATAALACGGDCADQAVSALEETVAMLGDPAAFGSSDPSRWLWGRKHRVYLRSLLSAAGIAVFDHGPFANDGGLYTVDVANFDWADDGARGFVQGSGANVRFAAEMRAGAVRWRAVVPGGASDDVGDPTWQSMLPAWLANERGDLPWSPAEVAAAARSTLRFLP